MKLGFDFLVLFHPSGQSPLSKALISGAVNDILHFTYESSHCL